MAPAEAKFDQEKRLAASGFDFSRPRLDLAWKAFGEHLGVSLEGARDYVLIEAGVYDFEFQPLRAAFTIDLCRQFGYFDEEDEFEGYEQLHLMLYFQPAPDLEEVRLSEFWEEGMSREQLLEAVESSDVFRKASAREGRAALLMQWEV
ncbi:MAG TPA: hypothetical protein VIL30_03515 [Ramlibacter sp.]